MSFIPRSPTASSGEMEGCAESFRGVLSNITGQSEDMLQSFMQNSMEFSEMLSEHIKEAGEINYEHWAEACMAALVASEVCQQWSNDISWYEKKIESLYTQLENIAPFLPTDLESGDSPRDIFVASLQTDADRYWDELEERADDCTARIEGGTNPENVAVLMSDGRLGWLPNNFMGDVMPIPVDGGDGAVDGDDLQEMLEEGEVDEERYDAIMAMLIALNNRAAHLQQAGGELTKDELDYLESLYGALEELEGDKGSDGVISIPEYLEDIWGEDQAEANRLLRELGEGILTLSDENLGGGPASLPESIWNASQGPFLGQEGIDEGYIGGAGDGRYGHDLSNLALLLGGTSDDHQAGVSFSMNLSLSLGELLYQTHEQGDGSVPEDIIDFVSEEQLGSLIEVGVRNVDANQNILMGEFSDGFYMSEESAQRINDRALEGLMVYQWGEDGEADPSVEGGRAVQGLFDWLSTYGDSSDLEKQEQAAETMYHFIDWVNDPDRIEFLMQTGNTAESEIFGTPDNPISYEDAGFGLYNGHIASSLTDAFEVYIDSFASNEGFNSGGIDSNWTPPDDFTWDPETNQIVLSPEDRKNFIALLATHDESSLRIDTHAELYGFDRAAEASETGMHVSNGTEAGNLRGLVDAAFQDEMNFRQIDASDQHERRENMLNFRASLITDNVSNAPGFSDVPIIGDSLSAYSSYVSQEIVKDILGAPGEEQMAGEANSARNEDSMRNALRGQLLARIAENNDPEDPDSLSVRDLLQSEYEGRTGEEFFEDHDILHKVDDTIDVISPTDLMDVLAGSGDSSIDAAQIVSDALEGTETEWIEGREDRSTSVLETEFMSNYSNRVDSIREEFDLSVERTNEEKEENEKGGEDEE